LLRSRDEGGEALIASDVPPGTTFLDSLVQADRAELLAAGYARSWRRGELLIRSGDRADSAIVLRDGLVKVHKSAAAGHEVVLDIAGPGDLLGEITAVRDALRSANVTALEPVDGVMIPVSSLRTFLADHPRAALALLDLALARLRIGDARRLEFANSESLGRVASRLVELAERFGSPHATGAIEVGLPINQEDLAAWSATSKESTARSLRTLRELGLIETSRLRLRVLDLTRLRSHTPRL
jgi:CRP/FNR family transcriptional regulator, cyclic AMP receptor protein